MTAQSIAKIDVSWTMNGRSARAAFDLLPGVTALIGRSGAGKTTLARILCGLKQNASGYFKLSDRQLLQTSAAPPICEKSRNVGLVMQDPALFPTMTVADNIALGSVMLPEELETLFAVTGTETLLKRMPKTLSGGEARRVAIVRAMAAKPALLILDEPMTGLDPKRRREIMALVRTLAHTSRTPVLLITHQLEEMLFAADNALLIDDGEIIARGSVNDVLAEPETAKLLGIDDAGTLLTATVSGREDHLLVTDIGGNTLYISDDGEPVGASLRLRIMARDIALSPKKLAHISVLNQLRGTVAAIDPGQSDDLITVKLAHSSLTLQSRITRKSCNAMGLNMGDTVYCLIKAVAVKELIRYPSLPSEPLT